MHIDLERDREQVDGVERRVGRAAGAIGVPHVVPRLLDVLELVAVDPGEMRELFLTQLQHFSPQPDPTTNLEGNIPPVV